MLAQFHVIHEVMKVHSQPGNMVSRPRLARFAMSPKIRHKDVVSLRQSGYVALEDLAGARESM